MLYILYTCLLKFQINWNFDHEMIFNMYQIKIAFQHEYTVSAWIIEVIQIITCKKNPRKVTKINENKIPIQNERHLFHWSTDL